MPKVDMGRKGWAYLWATGLATAILGFSIWKNSGLTDAIYSTFCETLKYLLLIFVGGNGIEHVSSVLGGPSTPPATGDQK